MPGESEYREDDWVVIAQLGRVRGNRGELTALPLTSHPERFEALHAVTLKSAGGLEQREIESSWWHQERLILKFKGVDSISEAEKLEGFDVLIPKQDRIAVPEGEYFHADLIGCQLIDLRTKESIGVVADVQEFGGSTLLAVEGTDGKEILVPFARAICQEIDIAAREIRADLPEGLDGL